MCECGSSGVGKYFGKIGGQLGDKIDLWGRNTISAAQKRFKDWSGLGDYKVNFNSLINPEGEPPAFASHGRGLIIRHKEYLGDVVTSPAAVGAFNLQKFIINPGSVLTFPWLSPIALQHDQYRPRGIIFEFVSTASETSTTASLGSVLFSTQYDVTDPDPQNKSDMLNREYSNETKMSISAMHGLECDPAELQNDILYTRAFSSAVQNARDFDMANFYIGTQGGTLPVSTIVGSLYVHYEFEFFKQIPAGGLPAKTNIWGRYINTTNLSASTTVDFTNFPLTLNAGRDLGITFSGLQVRIPKIWQGATFLIELAMYTSNPGPSSNPSGYTPINCTATTEPNLNPGGGYWRAYPRPSGASVNNMLSTLLVTITSNINTDATITFATVLGTFPGTSQALGTQYIVATIQLVNKDYLTLQ